MPVVDPFRGVRYATPDHLQEVVCPPYDVVSAGDQERLTRLHPHNAVRLELGGAPRDAAHYMEADRTFRRWMQEGVLSVDEEPSYYVYRQDFTTADGPRQSVTGVIGAVGLEPFGPGAGVLPHEHTMPGPKADRLALMRACPMNVSPIYAVYRGRGALRQFFETLEGRPTAGRFADSDGILHRLWVVQGAAEKEVVREVLAAQPLVIADGHHRYETALAFRDEQGGPGPHDAIMTFCVDADSEGLVVLPYHRAVTSDAPSDEVATRLRAKWRTRPLDPEEPPGTALGAASGDHVFAFVFAGQTLLVEVTADEVADDLPPGEAAWRSLDVVVLHETLLPSIVDGGRSEISFSTDPARVAGLVGGGEATFGVLLRPLDPAEIVDVARGGARMPQKASYFWPKAVTGLVFRPLVTLPRSHEEPPEARTPGTA